MKAFKFKELPPRGRMATFSEEVLRGLSAPRKSLPSRFLYDDRGSELFERITDLPEYYLTRLERQIIQEHADEIAAAAAPNGALVEFGSGSSEKTRELIDAILRRQPMLLYVPIDISASFLRASAEKLLDEYDRLQVQALAAEYHDAINALPAYRGPRLILFLGSSLGNFHTDDAREFLGALSAAMKPGDSVLVGIDLVKDPAILERAYDDSEGVTSEFNKNLLARINRELGGHFDLNRFRHWAPYVEALEAVEMRLVSTVNQTVVVDLLGRSFKFNAGEWIHTETCQKYRIQGFRRLAASASLTLRQVWTDPTSWFAICQLERA